MDHKQDSYAHLGVMLLLIVVAGLMFAGFVTAAITIVQVLCA
jgi:hypothetical protein